MINDKITKQRDNPVASMDLLAKPFAYTFHEHGGYDCMTSSYSVINGNGKRLFDIDCADYGQKRCHNGQNKDAEAVAKGICDMANIVIDRK